MRALTQCSSASASLRRLPASITFAASLLFRDKCYRPSMIAVKIQCVIINRGNAGIIKKGNAQALSMA
jgi:hypothetical protein